MRPRRLSYANVMSTVAVFIALGGGAVAATSLTSTPGVVTLCVGRTGSVKVLTGKRCARKTKLVAVNERGIQGLPGPQGKPGVSGTASGYSAAPGLLLKNDVFSPDLTALQARITNSGCLSDQALQAVSQSGAPTCASLHAYSATGVSASDTANVPLSIPVAGSWLLIGQAEAKNNDSSYPTLDFNCKLQLNGNQIDTVDQYIPYDDNATVSPLATVTTTGTSSVLEMLCNSGGAQADIGALELVALPLAALN